MAASGYQYRVNVTNTKNGATSTAVTSNAVGLTVNKATQATLSFTINIATKTSPYSQAITMTPSGGTGDGATTYAIVSGGSATSCALANNTASNTITATTSGTCLIQATKAADTNYLVTTSSNVTFTFSKADQSALSVTVSGFMRGETTSISSSGGSTSETITYSVSSGPCSVSGSTLSSTGLGDCVVVATRPGNSNYELVTGSKSITVSPSNKAGLSTLTITPGTAIFTSASSTYAISVSSTVTTISFTPTFTSPFASATFGGAALSNGVAKTFTPTSGTNTPFNLVVTADDGTTTKTYIIKVTKVATTKTTTSPKPKPTPTPRPTPTPTPTKKTTQPAKVPAVSLAPRITGLSNSSGVAISSGAALTNVTITGTNLTGATVRLNGKSAVIVSNNGTQLVFRVPTGVSSGVVTVLTSKGSASSARFTVTS